MSDLSSFASAIANAEGYGVAGAIPTVNNNPGDLVSNGSVTSYSTPEAGQSALMSKLSNIFSGNSKVYSPSMTLSQMGSTWANGDSNWASNVAKYLGVSPSSVIGDIVAGVTGGLTTDAGLTGPGSSNVLDSLKSAHSSVIGKYLEDAIFVVIGLMMIAAGVFAFKNSSTVIQVVGKAARTAAEVSA